MTEAGSGVDRDGARGLPLKEDGGNHKLHNNDGLTRSFFLIFTSFFESVLFCNPTPPALRCLTLDFCFDKFLLNFLNRYYSQYWVLPLAKKKKVCLNISEFYGFNN
jgi:hypothetical protein